MVKSNSELSENSRFFGTISASVPFKNLLSKSNRRSKVRSDDENTAPINSNIQLRDPPLSASTSFSKKNSSLKPKVRDFKEDLTAPVKQQQPPEAQDPSVKVVVRIRPANGTVVRKNSTDTVSVGETMFKFDSVFDSDSTQGDVYKVVGAPMVKDALSGYNTSLVAYGQTGSGKSYSMWGPLSAMVSDGPSVSSLQGVVPRIFQELFSKIQKEQEKADDKLINYQCRCSLLEVYDGEIGDLLDTTQQNLEIKDDAKLGFNVENLTEEYVTSYEDVSQILIKGLLNRKIGATRMNSKSSRSHVMFTCIIESWCKESSSKCFGSSKTSRISLVDLAGFERNTSDNASRQHVREGKYIKKSMSQLGHLISIQAEGRLSEKDKEVPYKSSCLTQLLRESFGGNTKLSIICSISPDDRSTGETLSTLRFGLRAKLMKNEPLANEVTEDGANGLSDQIRQLKEELVRAKSTEYNSLGSNQGYFSGRKVRESVNQLRISLNRSLILPRIDIDSKEDLSINEDDVNQLRLQIDNISSSHEENLNEDSAEGTSEHFISCSDESENEETNSDNTQTKQSISGCPQSMSLEDPVLSESPKINSHRKSLAFLSNVAKDSSGNENVLRKSHQPDHLKSSLRSSRIISVPTESIAASLHKGLDILDYHQNNPELTRSSVSFSFEHLALKPCLSTDKVKIGSVHTPEDDSVASNEETCIVVADGSSHGAKKNIEKDLALAIQREKELRNICKEQTAQIEHLNQLLEKYKHETHENVISGFRNSSNFSARQNQLQPIYEDEHVRYYPSNSESKLLTWKSDENPEPEFIKEECEIKEVMEDTNHTMQKFFSLEEREALLRENEILRNKLQSYTDAAPTRMSSDKLRSSLLLQSMQLRKSSTFAQSNSREELEAERDRWMEMESDWISLTDELRIDIESYRQRAEQREVELKLQKKCTEELDDALNRSVLGHARMVEHYAELQDKYNDIEEKHRAIMESIAEVKRAASKAGAKGQQGSRFAKALSAELSALRVEKERERELLKKENRSLKIQLKDTAEAVHAAGELLVRLREAEEAASLAEEKNTMIEEENEKLKKQNEKLKRKHKMEMITMKQYLAESRLPEAALRQQPLFREDSYTDTVQNDKNSDVYYDDDQAWRAEFGAIYQDHHY